jgi:hypothetical protein
MRKFFSYGPPDIEENYCAPRKELLDKLYQRLTGDNPQKGGHYFTVWAPRQTGKTWCLNTVRYRLLEEKRFDVVKIGLEALKKQGDSVKVGHAIVRAIFKQLGKEPVTQKNLDKPLIVILDEFDALKEEVIYDIVSVFRDIYISRYEQTEKKTEEKDYLLHGLALIGVRRVLGVENKSGSPFNIQRSVRIPNLTQSEVWEMFQSYVEESGQAVEKEAVDRLFYETQGQPGLIGWFGELLTEGWEDDPADNSQPINLRRFNDAYDAALSIIPCNNILNILSKAREPEHKGFVIDLFRTDEKINFRFDNIHHNYLYLNGVIDREVVTEEDRKRYYVKFSSPFVQNKLFQSFSEDIFDRMTGLIDPMTDVEAVIGKTSVDIKAVLAWYQIYLQANKGWLLKDVPRRADLRIHEAVFHFNIYMYLFKLLTPKGAHVLPEFPAGNGKIDLLIRYQENTYGLELKTFKDRSYYKDALTQAARYGKQLGLTEITLVFFIGQIDDTNRQKLETPHTDNERKICVKPIFIETGE